MARTLRAALAKSKFQMNKKRFKEHFSTDSAAVIVSSEHMQALADRYQARFGNFDEISHPSIMTLVGFLSLLEGALASDVPLNRRAVETIFPSVGWEEIDSTVPPPAK